MTTSPSSAAKPAPKPVPEGFSPRVYGFSKWLLRVWARIWLRLRLEGLENAPKSGSLLAVGNHASYLDPPLLGCGLPRPVLYLAKKELANFAPLRWWLRKVGVGLIDRNAPSKDVLRTLSNALAAGSCVAMFPEGTRSEDGLVAPFGSGVEFLVRRTGASVLPIGIEGSFRSYPRGAKFPRPTKCVVRVGQPWPAERVLAPGGIEALRAEVARLAHAELRRPRADGAATSASAPVDAATGDHGPGPVPAETPSSPSAGNRS